MANLLITQKETLKFTLNHCWWAIGVDSFDGYFEMILPAVLQTAEVKGPHIPIQVYMLNSSIRLSHSRWHWNSHTSDKGKFSACNCPAENVASVCLSHKPYGRSDENCRDAKPQVDKVNNIRSISTLLWLLHCLVLACFTKWSSEYGMAMACCRDYMLLACTTI